MQKKYYVYILEFTDHSLYTGVTKDLNDRLDRHRKKRGSKYARGHGPFNLVYAQECGTLAEARRIELKIKKYSNHKKRLLIQTGLIK